MINKEDAVLCVDVTCYECKRTAALSNTVEIDGRRYCEKCIKIDDSPLLI